jgi:hypothetical protein
LADFLARKDFLADFLLEALLDFLAVGFAFSVCNIFSYPNITNLPNFYLYISILVLVVSSHRVAAKELKSAYELPV